MAFVFTILTLAAMVYALVDIIMRDDSEVKHLPKLGWILLVVLLPLIGTILWFAVGRERSSAGRRGGVAPAAPAAPQAVVPQRAPGEARSTEEQLADLDREIEYYEKRAELERRRREVGGEAPG
ncbi:PLDc N-terminal domain-containing protein [Agromyces lapidis]|uniref:PLDc N-terminal domain-containing protein n=1 Tax=Agromyces lapidis TaxID=279574 RepID=A0ABV5SS13_9MICO|nr:PLDc N-terminal domain-containing protein [Agromyces lapidis]